MTALSKRVRPVNSLLFVSDPDGGEPPKPVRGAQILSTSSCILVSCYPEQDGPTEVVLGDRKDVDPGVMPMFDGVVETPSRMVVVSTATYERLLQKPVSTARTRVLVWLNNPRWADKVIVGTDDLD